jgi:hypothetical protein
VDGKPVRKGGWVCRYSRTARGATSPKREMAYGQRVEQGVAGSRWSRRGHRQHLGPNELVVFAVSPLPSLSALSPNRINRVGSHGEGD